jgi:hypothetical protein
MDHSRKANREDNEITLQSRSRRESMLEGECKRIEGETSGQFYARLRHWLDRDMPQTKSPLHSPTAVDEQAMPVRRLCGIGGLACRVRGLSFSGEAFLLAPLDNPPGRAFGWVFLPVY